MALYEGILILLKKSQIEKKLFKVNVSNFSIASCDKLNILIYFFKF